MSSDGTALRHNALVYESKDEYLAGAVPFLKAGIEAGGGAVVAHTKPGLGGLREGPGPQAARGAFLHAQPAHPRPAGPPPPDPHGHLQQRPETPDPPPVRRP